MGEILIFVGVMLLLWGLAYLGISIPEPIMRVIWFLVIILVLIAVVSFLAGGLRVPPLAFPHR
jgi:hypothetical protein